MAPDFDQHQRMLRGSGKTTLNLPAIRSDPKPDQVLLDAVRDIAQGEYDVLGEMGRGKKGSVVYLARDLQTSRLVALKLEHEGLDEYGLEVLRALDKSLPAVEGSCPRCGSRLAGWGRFCPQCGADVSGAVQDKSAAELVEAVKDAAGADLEVLGEMDRAEGGGRVYFARDKRDGRIIALRLQKDPDAQGADEYVIDRTQVLKPIAAGVDATVMRPAVKPSPPSGPPPVLRPAPKLHGRSGLMRTADFARTVAADRRVLIGAAVVAVLGVVAIIVALGGNGQEVVAAPEPQRVAQTPPAPLPTPTPVDSPQVEIRAAELPPNARITVDGRDFAPGARFKLSPGSHVFRIAASGFRAVVDTVELGQGQSLIYSTPTLQREQTARRDPPPPRRQQPAQTRPQSEPEPVAQPPRVTCSDAYQNADYAQARGLCEQAMAVGDPVAIMTLGIMNELGRGVPADLARASDLYRRAANAGNARAQLNLGIMYQDGRGVERDDVRAAALFRQAAEQGSPDAQAQLGHAYQLGRGVDQNLPMARSWYARGAEQNHSWSQFLLAYLLLEGGGGVERNEAEAFRLFLSAAQQNLVAAQLEVAKLYRDGRGVAQSTASAIEWYERAGTPEAVAEAQRLRNR